MNGKRAKLILWSSASVALVISVAAILWVRTFHQGLPHGIVKDIRAGIAARHVKDPDERLLKYLDQRYGSMAEPANRQAAFLDFSKWST